MTVELNSQALTVELNGHCCTSNTSYFRGCWMLSRLIPGLSPGAAIPVINAVLPQTWTSRYMVHLIL